MKQRIIATILLLVTVLATFAGCANYAFAEKANFADYATVDYDALLKALHTIEIEEEDFGPEEDRQAIVVDEIYNTLLTALYSNADNKQKNGTISSVRDVVEYYYYCTYESNSVVYAYDYKMTTTTNTTTTSSATDAEKALKKAIVEKILGGEQDGFTFDEETAYTIKTTLSNEKVTKDDVIVVSYTLKTTDANGVVTYKDYAYHTIHEGIELFDAIITNSTDTVVLGTYKSNEAVEVNGNVYKNISISHIVEKAGTSVTVEQTTEDEQDVTAYVDGVKTTVTIPEGATVTYHVYPVSYVSAPVVDADLIVRYVLGDDITTTSLDVFGSEEYTLEDGRTVKALVEQLVAEYKKTADDYAGGDVELAKAALAEERVRAKAESVKDAIDALAKALNNDNKKVTDAILEHYNSKHADAQAADIYAVFAALSANGKVKFADLLPTGILGLYTYKNSSDVSAVSLVNDINAEYEKDVNTAYDSYQKDTDSKKAGNEIDVVDKKERYEEAVAQAQNSAVNAIIEDLLACKNGETSVQDAIVTQYESSVYKTEFTSYDLLKNILLTSSSTDATFNFIDDLSDYVYGTSNVDDEERETFSSILKDLVAEFGKTTSDYEHVESVKAAKLAVETITIENKSNTTIAKYASELKNYKKTVGEGEEAVTLNAFNALAEVYIAKHPSTVYVISDAKTNEKLASSYSPTVLQLILDDKDNADAYVAALEGYNKTDVDTAAAYYEKAVATNEANKKLSDAEDVYAEAQETAHENAVNALIAKLLSATHTEDGETHKLSVVLAERYVDNTINTKISTYNTNVQNKLSKAIYEIINDKAIVNVDATSESYPAALIKEFKKSLKESYEYTYYTGTSSETTPGTPAEGVSPETRVEYDKWNTIYTEASAAMTSAETGISNAITAYVTALVTIYDMEAVLNTETPYFNADNALTTLVKAYFDANTAYNNANKANTDAKNALTKAEKALAEAEKYLETAKNEKVEFSTLFADIAARAAAIKDAKAQVKAAKKAVEEADVALNGTKKNPNGTKQALETATKALADAKDALVEAFSQNGNNENFVKSEEGYSSKKSTYSSESTDYSDEKTKYNTYFESYTNTYNTKKADYEAKQAIVDAAGENATEEEKTAAATAKTAMDEAKTKLDTLVSDYRKDAENYLNAAKAYAEAALTYYADSYAVKNAAQADYDAADEKLNGKKDEDGNVIEEGLKSKIANAESDTAGKTLSNVDAYGSFDAYLEATLGYNYEEVLEAEARKMLDEQIRVYAVAKALNENVVANGATVVIDENTTYTVEAYKSAVETREATFKSLITHSIKHNDEDIKDGKLNREVKKSWKELVKSTEGVFVTNKVYNQYKRELGRSNYVYAKNQYGENNLRMYLQFENLFSYLLFTDYQENAYAAHDGEYTVLEVKDAEGKYTGKLGYLFINYSFKAEDAE